MRANVWVVFAIALVSTDALAFVCSRADETSGASLSWGTREAVFTFFEGGTSDINGLDEFDTIRDAYAVWENLVTAPTDNCVPVGASTDFRWVEDPVRSNVDRVGFNFIDETNNENLVIFRDDRWPYPGREDRDLALATVTFNRVTGEILDADMEFNTANTQYTNRELQPVTDLLNTAVHEIGHHMGLAHVPNDGTPANINSSMFGSAAPGETKKRDLNCT
ncbi:MAG: matrixin family metalloprotease, partial [Myxococcota bacterium]